ncbi:hypothetical protein POM88_029913 [Heracleum sosnowskyi]|uniref:Uncharacterized protein n=1 Tax=Heracleum sosnowskyi TaxID=360622 RepID=A0AAD8HXK5_9APIA|nr:hypothetical protein POM88_029913 [Heracleum sosnowskyi]
MKSGRPNQFMQPPVLWLNQRPLLDVKADYDESCEEVGMGASHESTKQGFFTMSSGKRKRDASTSEYINGYIPQQDGSGDAISDESKFHVTENDVLDDDDKEGADYEPLNENDDDLDGVDQEEDLKTQNFVLAQFDKVDHSRGRWKCTLKGGIMHINKKDILFKKANGQFEFYNKNSEEQLTKKRAGEVAPPPAVVKPPTVVKPLLVYVRVMGGSAAEKKATACSGMKRRRLEDKPGGCEASRRKSSYRRRLMMLLNKPLLRWERLPCAVWDAYGVILHYPRWIFAVVVALFGEVQ